MSEQSMELPYHALLVDDEPAVLGMLTRLFKFAGWEVRTASSIRDASVIIADESNLLHMLVLDLRLPDGDGMDLVPIAQAREEVPDIVVITGYASFEAAQRTTQLGLMDILSKPVTGDDISVLMRRWQSRQRQRHGIFEKHLQGLEDQVRHIREVVDDMRQFLSSLGFTRDGSSTR